MGINPLGPLKLLNFKDRVPKAVQKWRLGICLKVRKSRAWHLHRLLLPPAAKSWIASEHCPEHKWGTYHGGDGTESS